MSRNKKVNMTNPFEVIEQRLTNIEALLINIKHLPHLNYSQEDDKILTIDKAAEFLHLSVPTIYGLVHESKVPHSKKGKRLYFFKTELEEWIKAGKRKTISEITAEAELYVSNGYKKRG